MCGFLWILYSKSCSWLLYRSYGDLGKGNFFFGCFCNFGGVMFGLYLLCICKIMFVCVSCFSFFWKVFWRVVEVGCFSVGEIFWLVLLWYWGFGKSLWCKGILVILFYIFFVFFYFYIFYILWFFFIVERDVVYYFY